MKHKKVILLVSLVSIIIVGAFFTIPRTPDIPHVNVDTNTDVVPVVDHDDNPATEPVPVEFAPGTAPTKPATVSGTMEYTLAVVYVDGSRKTYTETFQFPDLTLSLADPSSKEIDRFEFKGTAKLTIPQEAKDKVRTTADAISNVKINLGGATIKSHQATTAYSIDQLASGITLFDVKVTAAEVNEKIGSGTYALSFEDSEKIVFKLADFTEKAMEIHATPSFELSSDSGILKAISVVTVTPTATASLEKIPSYGSVYVTGQCPVGTSGFIECQVLKEAIVGYTTDVVIKANNFKPLSDIKFDYTNSAKAGGSSGLIPYTVVMKKTDMSGSAEDRYHYNSLYDPECAYYYALFKIGDGSSEVRGKAGCNSYYWSIRNCACAEASWQISSQKQYEDDFLAGKVG